MKLEGLGRERKERNKRNQEVIVQILNQGHFQVKVLFNQLMQLPLMCVFFCTFFFLSSLSTHRHAFRLFWPPHKEVKGITNL